MTTPRLNRVLVLSLLLAVSLSCTTQATVSLPASIDVGPDAMPTASRQTGQQGRQPKQLPTPQAWLPLIAGSGATEYSLILGRPTTDAITASLYAAVDMEIMLAYGAASGQLLTQTSVLNLKANAPQNVALTQLLPDAAYYYRVIANGATSAEHTFHTQRASGTSFTFTVDADPHNRDPNFNGELYVTTLTNARNDHPDFHINLGDTFMTEKVHPQTITEAASTFTDMRSYFGIIGADAPLFLVNGNHEGELGWLLTSRNDKNLPIWSTQLRQLYYPNPAPNSFYSGATAPDATLGAAAVRDSYFAWTWGDAVFIVLDPFWYTLVKPQPNDPNSNWNWTLGRAQYDWLARTLASSTARYKFVFTHHLVGGNGADARGGIEAAPFFEWGGKNPDGTYGFDVERPGWGKPIHQLLVENRVNVVFHGHDHVFVKQDLDGIVYQEVPQPSVTMYNNTSLAEEYGYVNGDVRSSSGHLRVTVTPAQATVEYVRAYLIRDENNKQRNGQIAYSYAIK